MINIDKITVFNFEGAFRGLRNPKNSWNRSDSHFFCDDNLSHRRIEYREGCAVDLGNNDLNLAQRMISAGTDEAKFMRQIFVSMDIEAPLYWWKEMDQYRISVTTSSTSTMHRIMAEPFNISMFSVEQLRGYKKSVEQKPNQYDEDTEEWADWPLNSLYQVSNQGRVKRKEFTTTHNRTWKERILTNTETSDHYLKVGVKINGQQKDLRVHQLVAQTWIDNPYEYSEINHLNGNKLDNRVENLEWSNSKLNSQHASQNNLQPKGIQTYKGKLTKEQRDEIVQKYNTTNISKRQLAKDYNVSHTTINAIFQNKYNYGEGYINEYEELLKLIDKFNELREEWLITKDKEVWYSLIQLLPESWNQKRTWTANYQTLRAIYFARRYHKLVEWHEFCRMIEKLPYGKELICYQKEIKE